MVYNQRAEDEKHFLVKADPNDDHKMTGRQKTVICLFWITFVVMILGLIPWSNLNSHWTFFDKFTKWLINIPFLGDLLGHDMAPLGTWYFNEITMLFLFMSVLIMAVYHMKESEFIDAFMSGMGDFLSVAIIVAVARGIQVIMNNGMITGTVINWGELGLHGLSKTIRDDSYSQCHPNSINIPG